MPKYIIIGVALCAAVLLPLGILRGENAPEFFLSNVNGERFYSDKSKNMIISFFFVGCIPCRKEIPQLYHIVDKERLNTDLLYIDPIREDSTERIKAYARNLEVPANYFYRDALGNVAQKYLGKSKIFPTIVGIRNKHIIFRLHELDKGAIRKITNSFKH